MLDRLYVKIGEKLKDWAKWIFIVESISAIIGGIAIMVEDSDSIHIGLLVIVLGPLIALVSTWILYAFGQLVDNSDGILEQLKEQKKKAGATETRQKPIIRSEDGPQTVQGVPGVVRKTIICPKCGKSQFDGRSYCFACGARLDQPEA